MNAASNSEPAASPDLRIKILIVIAVLALLASLSWPSLAKARKLGAEFRQKMQQQNGR